MELGPPFGRPRTTTVQTAEHEERVCALAFDIHSNLDLFQPVAMRATHRGPRSEARKAR